MEYTRLGKSGLKVSRICLGFMSFGSHTWQPWVLDEEPAIEIIKKAYELGINFFDTADVYSNGESEVVLGNALKKLNIPRSNIVIATKVFNLVREPGSIATFTPAEASPSTVNAKGLSRKHIFEACEASLARLQVDYIDLYQVRETNFQINTGRSTDGITKHPLKKPWKR
jgi:aryl-alcohol dehydrogenase-like predicted oxidoreductase